MRCVKNSHVLTVKKINKGPNYQYSLLFLIVNCFFVFDAFVHTWIQIIYIPRLVIYNVLTAN